MAPSRKRRRRAPRGWSDGLDDRHNYMQAPAKRAASRARRAAEAIMAGEDQARLDGLDPGDDH
jgi:hypothetical protein